MMPSVMADFTVSCKMRHHYLMSASTTKDLYMPQHVKNYVIHKNRKNVLTNCTVTHEVVNAGSFACLKLLHQKTDHQKIFSCTKELIVIIK